MDENIVDEEKKVELPTETTTGDITEGSKQETTPLIEQTNAATERREAANRVTEELLIRQERLMSDRMIGGTAEAGVGLIVPKRKTDSEYAEAYERGEVDPFKEDGFV